jgi:hypothetical protein
MEATQNKSDVTIQFLVGGLVFTLPEFSIYLVPFKSYSRISCLCNGEFFFQFLGANLTPKIFFANLETTKRYYIEKICVDSGIMVQVAIPVRAVGFPKNKKRVNTSGNCIFHVYREPTPLNRLLSFLAHRVISPT